MLVGFVCGIAIGAVFSPFWMKVWSAIKNFVSSKFGNLS